MRTSLWASAFALLLQFTGSAQTVHYVTSPFDSGAGSFRTVVAQALSGDTIRFQVSGTITLLTGSVGYDKDLVIEGPGMDQLTLSGNDQSTVLDITGHSSRISGLSITHGVLNGVAVLAGGLNFVGDTLHLEGVRIADCSGTGTTSSMSGGGTIISAARVRMIGCELMNNTINCQGGGYAIGGAAVIGSDDITLDDCLFTGNTAFGSSFGSNAAAFGGGLYVGGRGRITGCTFDHNSSQTVSAFVSGVFYDARSLGGGFYCSDSDVELVDCSFTDNWLFSFAAGDPNWYGAGIAASRSNLRLTGCTISGNLAGLSGTQDSFSQGGGVYLQDGYLTVEDCLLDSNQALDGSGIFYDIGSENEPHQGLTMQRSRVTRGIGSTDHAAIVTALADRVDLRDVEVSDNAQYSLAAGADTIRVDRCLFAGNHGGASLYNPVTNETHILNTTFTQSAAASSALYANSTTFFMINCTMVDDSLTTPGARELALDNSTVWMKNTILGETWFHGNSAFAQNGGSVISGGGNVCGDGSLSAYLTQPSDVNNTQPGMGAFADHGGYTRTWSLLGTSTCIDRGGADTLTVDQRGFLRDASSDAGAYEFGSADPAILIAGVTPDLALCVGQLIEVAVTASSGANLSYQWYLNGDLIDGATSAAYSTAADLSNAGSYTCSIWNDATSVVAGPVIVEVDICEGLASATTDHLRIYPNPTDAGRGLIVEPPADATVLQLRLADLEGRIIFQQTLPFADRLHIPLNGIAAGVYTLGLQWNSGLVSRRIVVR